MFRLLPDQRRVSFTLDDRDLAIALADIEGFHITSREGQVREPLPANFRLGNPRESGTEPEQESPGVWFYFVVRKVRFKPGKTKRKCEMRA